MNIWRRPFAFGFFAIACLMSLPAGAQPGSVSERMVMRAVKVVANMEFASWQPRGIDLAVEPESNSEELQRFVDVFLPRLRAEFETLGFEINPTATTKIRVSIDEYGRSRSNQLLGGIWGRGAVFGSVNILQEGVVAGSYQFSSRIRDIFNNGSTANVAEKLAPSLALKLIRGLRDDSLHSYRNKKLKSA